VKGRHGNISQESIDYLKISLGMDKARSGSIKREINVRRFPGSKSLPNFSVSTHIENRNMLRASLTEPVFDRTEKTKFSLPKNELSEHGHGAEL
jgi:hypothetical protein